ncbi:hypothetical protein GCM10009787_54340 [Streptomyces bangladeshensis]|uniref:Uncharacterized protein n=1 Tax=Streptomyces bangladeshensis TaxID=295352 RepID=A0ABN3BVV9_9ACTN
MRFLRRVGDALEVRGGVVVRDMCGAAMMTAREGASATMAARVVPDCPTLRQGQPASARAK